MTADSDKIGAAIEEWVGDLPGDPDRGILGDWLTIACFVSVDPDGDARAEYYVAMRGGGLLPHVAEGLIVRASEEIETLRMGGDDG